MAVNSSELQVAAAAMAADVDHVTLHTAQPDNTGSNLTSAGAQAVACTATGGVLTVPSTSFTGGAGNGACGWVGCGPASPAPVECSATGKRSPATPASIRVVDSVTVTLAATS